MNKAASDIKVGDIVRSFNGAGDRITEVHESMQRQLKLMNFTLLNNKSGGMRFVACRCDDSIAMQPEYNTKQQ
jgi:hypothetical protein